MDNTLSQQATNWREGRRVRAFELYQKGWKQKDIADALGVTQGAVSQWLKRVREGGIQVLAHRKPPGAPSRLSQQQREQLPCLLAQGAESFGFRGDVWTQGRIAELIRRKFGVSYDPSQAGRIIRACGLSSQKPVRRGKQRDEKAIRRFKYERWPELKKSHSRRLHDSVCG